MESCDSTETTDLQMTNKFMTAEELVALRKPKDQIQPSIGVKFSSPSGTSEEKEAVECALENLKDLLSQKRGARICDLIKAQWNEELKAAVTDKLKGKFAQHMGQRMDDKIVLSTEESLFLLENGCLEIIHGKLPISTEEAYTLMLKGHMLLEKYQVYSYLSQLGFIVIPHQKLLNQENSKHAKTVNLEKKKRKRVCSSPEDQCNKRITFSGALSENDNTSKVSPAHIVVSEVTHEIDTVLPFKSKESGAETSINGAELDNQVNESDEPSGVKETESENVSLNTASVPCSSETENSKTDSVIENQTDITVKSPSDLVSSSCFEEMNIDSQSSEVVFVERTSNMAEIGNGADSEVNMEASEKTEGDIESEADKADVSSEADKNEADSNQTEVDVEADSDKTEVDIETEIDVETEADIETEASKTETNIAEVNGESNASVNDNEESSEPNSEVMSCSSSDGSSDDSVGDNAEDVCMDDDITLLEVTKKETTPLAVIDLLSDDEAAPNQGEEEKDFSGSDDEIEIIGVCKGSAVNNKNRANGIKKEAKIKPQRMLGCKMEGGPSQNAKDKLKVPDFFRKDLVCVARPPANLLPFHVQPNKEVYVIDFKKHSQGQRESRPQGRLWNSYTEMQEYQRARRRNKHSKHQFPRFQPRDNRNWHYRNFRPYNDDSSQNHRQTFNRNDNSWKNSPRNLAMDTGRDNNSPHSRQNNFAFRNHSLSREQTMNKDYQDGSSSQDHMRDMDYRSNLPQEDRKPFRTSDSPVAFRNSFNQFSNQSDTNSNIHVPHLANSSSVNSVISIGHTGLRFPNQPMNNFSGSMSDMPYMGAPDFVTQVHRTAYSVATTMLSSMLGPGFNPNNLPPISAFPPGGSVPQFDIFPGNMSRPHPIHFEAAGGAHSPFMPSRQSRGDYHPYRRPHRGDPFPCTFRNVSNKKSWDDLAAAVGGADVTSDHSSDIEEVPVDLNSFLWNEYSAIRPLVKPGIKHLLPDLFTPLKLTKLACLTDKDSRNDKCFPEKPSIEISYDVYLPGTNFKKSCPGVPKYRVIVTRASSPIPKYSEIASLQRKWNDDAALQIAVVDNGDISFLSFPSVVLPDMTFTED